MPLIIINPTQQMLKTAKNVKCEVPLCGVEKCKIKMCTNDCNKHVNYEIDESRHLEQTDPYWAEFSKAQHDLWSNHLYKINIYGANKDSTIVKTEPFPSELIHQRLLHMPVVGALDKEDMFYLLSFILNLIQLEPIKQRECMELLQFKGLLDLDIINYMQILARHPNTCIEKHKLQEFLNITQVLINRASSTCNTNYFNPNHIFIKSMIEIDPYELEYLKNIMDTKRKLTQQQFMYLVKFVERLQEMKISCRDEYLKILHNRQILTSENFQKLICIIRGKAKKINRSTLQILMKELETLMNIGSCISNLQQKKNKPEMVKQINIDFWKINKALIHLMEQRIPNIVRYMELKNFLNDLMLLTEDHIEQIFNHMKHLKLIDSAQFKFMENFIISGNLSKGYQDKKKLLIRILQKVATSKLEKGIFVALDIPAGKGPKTTSTADLK